MANTLFAEKNKLSWTGIRPGVYGEQILVSVANVIVDTLLYTVPADKTLLLFNSWISVRYSTAAGYGALRIKTDGGVTVYDMGYGSGLTNIGNQIYAGMCRFVPIEIPEAYTISIVEVADGQAYAAGIEGILVDPTVNV